MTGARATTWSGRRADIDYLRVLALALLIVYHTLLVFNSWDWWRVKSEHAGQWADYITGALTPWRMSLVFFIGGIAVRFMLERARLGAFIAERASKLLVAFGFAVAVLVPMQRYVRLDEAGAPAESYLDYLVHHARFAVQHFGVWLPDFAHAWFLPYLFLYSAVAALLVKFAATTMRWTQRIVDAAPAWAIVGGVMIWFALVEALVLPLNPMSGLLFPDIGAHAKFAPMFLLGVFLGKSRSFSERLLARRHTLWIAAGALLALSLTLEWSAHLRYPNAAEAALDWLAVRGLYGGAMLFSVVAFAGWTLNRPSRFLTYASDAILPIYLMHQTVLVLIADFVVFRGLPLALEAFVLLAATALIPLAIYHVAIRHTPLLRVLFGLRPSPRDAPAVRTALHDEPPAQPAGR